MPMVRKVWVTALGWVLVIAGVAALVLPGPGLLMLLAGIVVLSQEYDWAERRVEPIKRRAFDAAEAGVSSVPRIIIGVLSACAVIGAGVLWWINPAIVPQWWILGPRLPFGGWTVGLSVIVSGCIALGLLVYSIRRFRWHQRGVSPEAAERARAEAGGTEPRDPADRGGEERSAAAGEDVSDDPEKEVHKSAS